MADQFDLQTVAGTNRFGRVFDRAMLRLRAKNGTDGRMNSAEFIKKKHDWLLPASLIECVALRP